MKDWTIEQSLDLYRVPHWGAGFFHIDPEGRVAVRPRGASGPEIDLLALVRDLEGRGLRVPLLIRFSDILASRVRQISEAFQNAIDEYGFAGKYRGVYPIKVNQQRHVVEEIVEHGEPFGLGLEAGSKPELLVALAVLDTTDALIICNGYKDRAYLETALLAQRLGRRPIIVIDRYRELELLIKTSKELGIRPHIGVRARLAARGAGKWTDSTGNRSKFGLSADEIVAAVERLRAEDMLDCLELLHAHIGSQITAISAHKEALREVSQVYVGLRELGAPLPLIDVGGGLGIDYDGSKTNFHSSMNYSVQEYANDVVAAIQEACEAHDLKQPDIVTESGRSLVAHHSVLIFDVLDVNELAQGQAPTAPEADAHRVLRDLYELWESIDLDRVQEAYHDALALRDETATIFSLGYFDLRGRAQAERLFHQCCEKILGHLRGMEQIPEDMQALEQDLADTYYGNFSVFQSAPDHWAVKQLFPVMPIHRLEEEPTRRGVLADLTCDSDGKIDRFIDGPSVKKVLELHAQNGQPYYIGMFLVGAYQEILGDLHNLFGDTHAAHVRLDPEGKPLVDHEVQGDDVSEVLRYVQYERRSLLEKVRRITETALRRGQINLADSARLRRRYEEGLREYTYLSRDD